jgi:hypothetical protein
MADYVPVNDRLGQIAAICPDCEGMMNQKVSWAKLDVICRILDVVFPKRPERLVKSELPSPNCDLEGAIRE